MNWDSVLVALTTRMANDSSLTSIYGEQIRKMGTHPFAVPSLDYMLISFTENELWAPHLIQFNQWTSDMDLLAQSARALDRLFNHEGVVVIEGLPMWAFFEDGGDLTGPDTEGYYGVAARYRFIPIRDRLLSGRSS